MMNSPLLFKMISLVLIILMAPLVSYSIILNESTPQGNQKMENHSFTQSIFYVDASVPPVSGNKAGEFDGSSSYVLVPDSAFSNMSQFSIDAWIKLNDYSKFVCPILERGSKDGGYSFWIGGEGFAKGKLILNGGFGVQAVSSSLQVDPGVWMHVAVVWDGRNVIFYKNGISEVCSGFSFTNVNSLSKLFVGRDLWASNNFFNGTIDEVRIYDRVLAGAEVEQHSAGVFSNDTGLVLYLPLDGDFKDYSGIGSEGVGYNVSWTNGFVFPAAPSIPWSQILLKWLISADPLILLAIVTLIFLIVFLSIHILNYESTEETQKKSFFYLLLEFKFVLSVIKIQIKHFCFLLFSINN